MILEIEEEDSEEEDIEDFMDTQLFSLRITPIPPPKPIPYLEGFYSIRHQ
jgi:hypothetical protein